MENEILKLVSQVLDEENCRYEIEKPYEKESHIIKCYINHEPTDCSAKVETALKSKFKNVKRIEIKSSHNYSLERIACINFVITFDERAGSVRYLYYLR